MSTRFISGMWYLFTLIMVSSYTANLAASLTAENLNTPIEEVEDLANQVEIKYGCMGGGSTSNFFKVVKNLKLVFLNSLLPECKGWNFPHHVELHGRKPGCVHRLERRGH